MEDQLIVSGGKHTLHGLNFYLSYFDDIAKVLDREDQCFIVGGWVRDRILGLPIGKSVDVDLLTTGDPVKVAMDLAERLGGDFFIFEKKGLLIKRPIIATVVLRLGEYRYRFDFSPLKGKDLEKALIEDLRDRDFTANALAVSLDDVLSIGAKQTILYDPTGGIKDLEEGVLRPVSLDNIKNDPVRLLRGYRIAVETELSLTEEFEEFASKEAHLLKSSPPERVNYELFRIMKSPKSPSVIRRLLEKGVLRVILPEVEELKKVRDQGDRHIYPLDEHTLKTLEFLEDVLRDREKYLPKEMIGGIGGMKILGEFSDIELLKWSAFLHDIGKPETFEIRDGKVTFYNHDRLGEEITKKIGKRLRWGSQATSFVAKLVRYHLRPFYLRESRQRGELKARGKAKFWRECEDIATHLFLLSIADAFASGDSKEEVSALLDTIGDLIEFKKELQREERDKPLLSGREIMEILGVPEGRLVGKLKDAIVIAQMEGRIRTKEEAKRYLIEEFRRIKEDSDEPDAS